MQKRTTAFLGLNHRSNISLSIITWKQLNNTSKLLCYKNRVCQRKITPFITTDSQLNAKIRDLDGHYNHPTQLWP